jgi:hypothetical protein
MDKETGTVRDFAVGMVMDKQTDTVTSFDGICNEQSGTGTASWSRLAIITPSLYCIVATACGTSMMSNSILIWPFTPYLARWRTQMEGDEGLMNSYHI